MKVSQTTTMKIRMSPGTIEKSPIEIFDSIAVLRPSIVASNASKPCRVMTAHPDDRCDLDDPEETPTDGVGVEPDDRRDVERSW